MTDRHTTNSRLNKNIQESHSQQTNKIIRKSDWGTLIPRINLGNRIKLGFLLELIAYSIPSFAKQRN
jgi:hypothetical protein